MSPPDGAGRGVGITSRYGERLPAWHLPHSIACDAPVRRPSISIDLRPPLTGGLFFTQPDSPVEFIVPFEPE
jgi:hypothetical protein